MEKKMEYYTNNLIKQGCNSILFINELFFDLGELCQIIRLVDYTGYSQDWSHNWKYHIYVRSK